LGAGCSQVRKPQLVRIIKLLLAPEIIVENAESALQALHRFAESTALRIA
jgi:hypothetical protein